MKKVSTPFKLSPLIPSLVSILGTLVPTKLGIVLIHGYYYIDSELVLPTVRSNIEKECTLIAKGKACKEDVVEHALNVFKEKFCFFRDNISVGSSIIIQYCFYISFYFIPHHS